MSQTHEPSYYEIALTNRQVLIVFVVLLICVVAAFFSGVWVGQRDAPAKTAGRVVAEPSQEGMPAEEGSAIDELHFFADEEGAEEPTLAEIAEDPQPATTLLEDLGGETKEPEVAVAVSEPTGAAANPSASTPDTAEQPAAASNGYVIQVFSSADETQARRLLAQLTDGGYPAFLSTVDVGSQTMIRVRIGPYTQLANAETVAERIRKEFKLDPWVTR